MFCTRKFKELVLFTSSNEKLRGGCVRFPFTRIHIKRFFFFPVDIDIARLNGWNFKASK